MKFNALKLPAEAQCAADVLAQTELQQLSELCIPLSAPGSLHIALQLRCDQLAKFNIVTSEFSTRFSCNAQNKRLQSVQGLNAKVLPVFLCVQRFLTVNNGL
jgi:hypothetical protein